MTDLSWHTLAACRGIGPELFYMDRSEPAADAKAVCSTCSVRAECLDWGIRHERYGVWGGETERGLRRLRRELGITMETPGESLNLGNRREDPRCGTNAGYHAHKYKEEQPCDPCRLAHCDYKRDWERRRRVAS